MVLIQFYISATLPRYDEVENDYDYANQSAYQPVEEGNAALSQYIVFVCYIYTYIYIILYMACKLVQELLLSGCLKSTKPRSASIEISFLDFKF